MKAAERHLLSLLPTTTLQNCRVAQSAEGGGRIVVASRSIPAGEELVRLPAHCALTAASFDALVAGAAALPQSLSLGDTADDVEMGKLVLVLLRASIVRASADGVGAAAAAGAVLGMAAAADGDVDPGCVRDLRVLL